MNADIKRSLSAALEHEPARDLHRDRIDLDFSDGVATLAGEVEDIAAKRRTLELAAALPPVKAIVDRLHVRPVEAMGDGAIAWWVPGTRDVVNGLGVEPDEQDTEQEIVDGLLLVLEKDPLVDASQVRASCKASVVTLKGLVGSDVEREAAEFDAWALFGVDRVVNRIEVRKTRGRA